MPHHEEKVNKARNNLRKKVLGGNTEYSKNQIKNLGFEVWENIATIVMGSVGNSFEKYFESWCASAAMDIRFQHVVNMGGLSNLNNNGGKINYSVDPTDVTLSTINTLVNGSKSNIEKTSYAILTKYSDLRNDKKTETDDIIVELEKMKKTSQHTKKLVGKNKKESFLTKFFL